MTRLISQIYTAEFYLRQKQSIFSNKTVDWTSTYRLISLSMIAEPLRMNERGTLK